MKPGSLLFAVSLAANAALFGAFAWLPSLAPPTFRDFLMRRFHGTDAPVAVVPSASTAAPARGPIWLALTSEDPATLIARLRAAGFPPEIIRAIVSNDINARYNARLRALMEPDPNGPFWKLPSYVGLTGKRLADYQQLQFERDKLLRDLFSDDFFTTDDVTVAQRRQFGNLPRQKIDQLRRVEDDYNDMAAQVRAATNGIMLPEDRAKLVLLDNEKRADLAAALTPDEFADYEMRSSPITNVLGSRFGGFNPSETEFRAIYQAEQAFSDQLGGSPTSFSSVSPQLQAAQQQFDDQLKAALGEARYADFSRETSSDLQQLTRLAQSASLPADAVTQTYNLRDVVAQESNRITDDTSLDVGQKRAALQALAQDTRTQIIGTLGPTAGPAYVKIANSWLTNVEVGNAVTFNSPNVTNMGSAIGGQISVSFGSNGPTYRNVARPAPPRQ